MRLIIIILFFIFAFFTMIIKIDVEKFALSNKKIVFKIKLKIYVFGCIKIFQKNIKKEDLYRLFSFSEKHRLIKKERKILKKIYPEIETLDFDLDYGMKNIFLNVYIYGLINAIVPSIITKFNVKSENRNYKIKTNFQTNYIKIKLKSRIKFSVFSNIVKNAKTAIQ